MIRDHVLQLDFSNATDGHLPQQLLVYILDLLYLPHSGSRQPPSYAHRQPHSTYYRRSEKDS